MILACFLFMPYHSVLADPVLNEDGSIDESATFTPGQMAAIVRYFRTP